MGVVTNISQARNGTEEKVLRKLDVGAGMKRIDGFTTMDISSAAEPDIVHDLMDMPWPFEDASWDVLRCHHVLEHMPPVMMQIDWDNRKVEYVTTRIAVMNEMHRILIPGGEMEIEVPVFPYWKAIADPQHLSFFVRQSFWYFCVEVFRGAPDWAEQRKLYGIRPWSMKNEARDEEGSILRVTLATAAEG